MTDRRTGVGEDNNGSGSATDRVDGLAVRKPNSERVRSLADAAIFFACLAWLAVADPFSVGSPAGRQLSLEQLSRDLPILVIQTTVLVWGLSKYLPKFERPQAELISSELEEEASRKNLHAENKVSSRVGRFTAWAVMLGLIVAPWLFVANQLGSFKAAFDVFVIYSLTSRFLSGPSASSGPRSSLDETWPAVVGNLGVYLGLLIATCGLLWWQSANGLYALAFPGIVMRWSGLYFRRQILSSPVPDSAGQPPREVSTGQILLSRREALAVNAALFFGLAAPFLLLASISWFAKGES